MQKRTASLIGIIGTLSLSGCAQMNYHDGERKAGYLNVKSRIEVNDDSYENWQKNGVVLQRYLGLSTDDVESQLVRLAGAARREDCWLYRQDARELIDVGHDGAESRTAYFCTRNMGEGESGLIFYHIHPCLCTKSSVHLSCTIREPVPSEADVAALVKLWMKFRGKRVEARVVNQFGVLRLSIDDKKYRGVPEMNRYAEQYLYGDFDFKEYQRFCAMNGLNIEFDERAPFVSPLGTE